MSYSASVQPHAVLALAMASSDVVNRDHVCHFYRAADNSSKGSRVQAAQAGSLLLISVLFLDILLCHETA